MLRNAFPAVGPTTKVYRAIIRVFAHPSDRPFELDCSGTKQGVRAQNETFSDSLQTYRRDISNVATAFGSRRPPFLLWSNRALKVGEGGVRRLR